MTRWGRWWVVGGLVVSGIGTGCRSAPPEIRHEWVVRLPPSEFDTVNEQRDVVRTAEDQRVRAGLAVSDAGNECTVRQSLDDAAETRVKAVEKAVAAARATGADHRIQRALSDLDHEKRTHAVAHAENQLAIAALEHAKAEADLAEAEAGLQSARLAQIEYRLLRKTGDVRVKAMTETDFDRAVAEWLADVRRADEERNRKQSKLGAAQAKLTEAQSRLSLAGAGPAEASE